MYERRQEDKGNALRPLSQGPTQVELAGRKGGK